MSKSAFVGDHSTFVCKAQW